MKKVEIILMEGAKAPSLMSKGACGYDLYANIENSAIIPAWGMLKISAGFKIHIQDKKYAAFIYPRSGMACSRGITMKHSVGVIDSDYQGEVFMPIYNQSPHAVTIEPLERIAQMVFHEVGTPSLKEVDSFSEQTERSEKGFGSTGEK
jgi:dUTP pyrophosphatase